MQGFERADRQLLDAEMLAGHLVPAGSMFAFLAAHRAGVFPDADYADLFAPPGVGRPSLPATRMAAILALQTLHDYSDRETAEAVRFDVRWKVACGLAVDDAGFDPSSLVYWRNRIAKSQPPSPGQRRGAQDRGGDRDPRRAGGAGRWTQRFWRTGWPPRTRHPAGVGDPAGGPGGARRGGDRSRRCAPGMTTPRPGKPKIDWDDPAAKDALVSALVNDANALVAALKGTLSWMSEAASALALLALVAGQDVEPAEGSDGRDGRWRIARKVAEDRVISTVDPDARHTRKSPEARRDGYRAHVAADPETGIITDEQLTKAAGQENSDPAVAEEFLAAEAAGEDTDAARAARARRPGCRGQDSGSDGDPLAWYGDSAYGTGDLRDAIEKAGHQAVIKPKPLRAPVEGGFTVDDFAVDEQAGTVTCPAGHTVALSRTRVATFGALCRDCPLREQCTTCKTGRKLVLHQRDDLLRAGPGRLGRPQPGCARTT